MHAGHVGEAREVHARRVVAGVQRTPRLVGGVRQDRREQAGQGGGHAVQGALGAAAARSICGVAVQPVFGGDQVHAAEGVVAKVEQRLGGLAELQRLVGVGHGLAEIDQLAGDPGVGAGGVGFFEAHLVGVEAEAVEVAEQEAHGVADLAVLLAGELEESHVDFDVVVGVEPCNPPAAHVGAVVFHEGLDGQRVTARLRHFLAVFVDHEPVGEHGLKGALAGDRQRGQERVLEPAAVLVAAFEVQVGGVAAGFGALGLFVVPALAQHRVPRRAGFKPDVEGVFAFGKRGLVQAFFVVVGQQVGGFHIEPGVAAFGLHHLGHGAHAGRVQQRRAVGFEKRGDGQAPRPLPAHAPVWARVEHAPHAVAAPVGQEIDGVFGQLERGFAHGLAPIGKRLVHPDKPLLGGAEDHRLFPAPVVRVAVHEFVVVEQVPAVAQMFDHGAVGLPDVLAHQPVGHGVVEGAVGLHRAVHVQAFAQAGLIVVGAVAGRGVHQAGAVFEGDVFSVRDLALAVAEGVLVGDANQVAAGEGGLGLGTVDAALGQHLGGEFGGEHDFTITGLIDAVLVALVHGHGQVGGQRPRRGGPDHQRPVGLIHTVEVHEHADVFAVVVFQLGLGQRGLVVDAPVHRFQVAVHDAFFNQLGKHVQHAGLVLGQHGQVGVVVVGHGQQALHLCFLQLHKLVGIAFAFLADLQRVHVAGFVAQVLHDLVLDGQAVAVPTRGVGAVVAGHGLAAHHQVFQDFVEQVPQVDVAVGIRRAVVKNVRTFGVVLGAQGVVHAELGPAFVAGRLVLHQVGLHGEGGFGQVQRLFVVRPLGRRLVGFCVGGLIVHGRAGVGGGQNRQSYLLQRKRPRAGRGQQARR